VTADDPQLTSRDPAGSARGRQPIPVVVGLREIPLGARVLDPHRGVVHLRTHDPHEVLARLFELDVHHVLLEGGPTLAGAFLAADLVDRAVGYIAPALLGNGPPMVSGLDVGSIADAKRFTFDCVTLVGGDLRWTAQMGASATPAGNTQGGAT